MNYEVLQSQVLVTVLYGYIAGLVKDWIEAVVKMVAVIVIRMLGYQYMYACRSLDHALWSLLQTNTAQDESAYRLVTCVRNDVSNGITISLRKRYICYSGNSYTSPYCMMLSLPDSDIIANSKKNIKLTVLYDSNQETSFYIKEKDVIDIEQQRVLVERLVEDNMPANMLISGLPGTGKSYTGILLAHALLKVDGVKTVSVHVCHKGNIQKIVNTIRNELTRAKNTRYVIVIDEFDVLLKSMKNDHYIGMDKQQLCNNLDIIDHLEHTYVIATSNEPLSWWLHPDHYYAIRDGRFCYRATLNPLTQREISDIYQAWQASASVKPGVEWPDLSPLGELTISTLCNLLTRCNKNPVRLARLVALKKEEQDAMSKLSASPVASSASSATSASPTPSCDDCE